MRDTDNSSAALARNDNGILNVVYVGNDPVAAQFTTESYGFVYGPAWLTSWGANVDVVASAGAGDFFMECHLHRPRLTVSRVRSQQCERTSNGKEAQQPRSR